jgi:iron complex outermembrane recepter protein
MTSQAGNPTYLPGFPVRNLLLAIGLLTAAATAEAAALQLQELAELSLEELSELSVVSVSRQPQRLVETPSAIQVITRDDIRRSGASSLPEALRLANNLQVAQDASQKWVITARGFSSDVGNKLLVMIDGRTVYTPLFSGVFWERQDYLLEDIERIEVISGPGGTLWGTNAVNGVINIITRNAADTQGLYSEAGVGTELRGFAGVRYGGKLAPDVNYRVYGKYADRNATVTAAGNDSPDAWDMSQAGFRIDATPSAQDNFTLQGDIYRHTAETDAGREGEAKGLNVLGRWTHRLAADSDLGLQVYYDKTQLFLPTPALVLGGLPLAGAGLFTDSLETLDADFQHAFSVSARNRLVWGLAYRHTHNGVGNAPSLAFFPPHLDQEIYSAFLQDEFTLLPERLILTLGSKFEHNDYTGWESAPNVRLQWNVAEAHMLWGAVSRAVRMPSRIDRDFSNPAPNQPPFNIVLLRGDSRFTSETVVAWEAGYRGQIGTRLIAAVSLFYNEYADVRSTSLSPPDPLFRLPFPFFFENNLEGTTHGLEFTANYQLRDWWRLSAGYTWLKEDIHVKPGRFDFNNALNETADPEHQVLLRSSMDLAGNVALDFNLRWVDALIKNNAGVADEVPAYAALDLRLGWSPSATTEVALVGRNLLDPQHPEFGVTSPARKEIERSLWLKAAWRF